MLNVTNVVLKPVARYGKFTYSACQNGSIAVINHRLYVVSTLLCTESQRFKIEKAKKCY